MAAVWLRFGAEVRTRWRAALGLALLVGLAGGIVLTAVAGARRTDSAYPRMIAATKAWDVLVNPDSGNDSVLLHERDQVRALPQVQRFGRMDGMIIVPKGAKFQDVFNTVDLAATDRHIFHDYFRPNVLEGRLADPTRAGEVMIESRYAHVFHLHVGDRFTAFVFDAKKLFTRYPSEADAFAALERGELGRHVRLHVTGMVTLPDLLAVDEGYQNGYALLTPAFRRKYPQAAAGFFAYQVQLKRGGADELAFRREVEALAPDESIEFQSRALIDETVDRAVRPYTVALWAFALAVAFTGVLVIGQAMARQRFLDAVDDPALAAIGCSRSQLLVLALLRAALVAVPGALVAVLIAYLGSPLMPIGPAGLAEVHPGLSFDAAPLGLGAALVALLVLALALLTARRLLGRSRSATGAVADRVPPVSAALARSHLGPVTTTGVRFALEPGRGRTAVPARTTLVTAALTVATVLAALTFAAGLDRLLSTPRLFGVTWQLELTAQSDDAVAGVQMLDRVLGQTPQVAGWSRLAASRVELDGRNVPAVAFRHLHGDIEATIAAGRAPRNPHEVALGRRTLDTLSVAVGDTVTARYHNTTRRLAVVGRVVLPGLGNYPGGDKTSPGDGVLLTPAGLRPLSPRFSNDRFPVRLEPGADVAAVRDLLARRLGDTFSVAGVQRPADVVDLRRVRATPVILAGMLALLGAATIANALVATIRRRRRDLALLKTLGFTRPQISGAIAWQASTIAVVAVVVGVPLGIAGGRWAWSVLASSIGFLSEPAVAWLGLAVALPVLLVGANLVAAVPAWVAGRTRPAAVLRTE